MTRREIAALCLFAVMLLLGGLSVNTAERAARTQETDLIRDAVRSAALTCYAVEGAYPQSLEALKHGYGLAYNEDAYIVVYDAFASNVMPDIQVLRKGAERP